MTSHSESTETRRDQETREKSSLVGWQGHGHVGLNVMCQ